MTETDKGSTFCKRVTFENIECKIGTSSHKMLRGLVKYSVQNGMYIVLAVNFRNPRP